MDNENEFGLQIISRGSIVDKENPDMYFMIETVVFRMSRGMFTRYVDSNPRPNLDDRKGKERKDYLQECYKKQGILNSAIVNIIGVDILNKSVNIVQNVDDVFTVVYIGEVKSAD